MPAGLDPLAGVAEAIGQTLVEKGLQVDVLPMQAVKDLSPYRAVVAGSAIRAQKWLPEAMQFIENHQSELSNKPFAAFMVCITLSMANAGQYLEGLKSWMSPVRPGASGQRRLFCRRIGFLQTAFLA